MDSKTTHEEREFRLTADELTHWNENGYIVRYDVFTKKENDVLRQIADDIVDGKRPFPADNINQNALVRDGEVEASGIHAMHKIHSVSFYIPEFLARVRDPRLTDPIVDLLGPNLLSQGNLYIWKAPKIGLGFPWHQDKWYFNWQYKTEMTVGTWTAIDAADKDNGCLYVIPGSHKYGILEHEDLEGSQQNEFKIAREARDEDGVAVELPPGSVVWFNNQLLHKSTDNHSLRFRRCNVVH
jgi:phytanoyl-CoA hydroxylase